MHDTATHGMTLLAEKPTEQGVKDENWFTTKRVLIPVDIDNNPFSFDESFRHKAANVRRMRGDFERAFSKNAKKKCEMPLAYRILELPGQHIRPLNEMIENGMDSRLPIRLLAWFKKQQVHGQEDQNGLLVNGNPTIFICRSRQDEMLRLVTIQFSRSKKPFQGGWSISSERYHERHIVTGPCRILVACRD